MLDKLQFETFTLYLNQSFTLKLPNQETVAVELAEVNKLGASPEANDDWRQAFSLIFMAPADLLLEQNIYDLTHSDMGTLPLFLVPVGPDGKTNLMRYEAVFT